MLKTTVRKYNVMAMAAPDCVWTPKFQHPRMSQLGDRVTLIYSHLVNHNYVAVSKPLKDSEVAEELKKLQARIKARSAK